MESEKYLAEFHSQLHGSRNDFRNQNLIELVARNCSGKKVLDIGCGIGLLMARLSQDKKKVFGIEPNEKLVVLAKKTNPGSMIRQGFSSDLSAFSKEGIDTVIMLDVLEHIDDDGKEVKRIFDFLPKKGTFIVNVPAFPGLYGIRDRNSGHFRRYSRKALEDVLKRNGFLIVKIRYWNMLGFFPYFFYEKVLKREISTELRTQKKSRVKRGIASLLDLWFRHVENNLGFWFGLSLFCVAEKI